MLSGCGRLRTAGKSRVGSSRRCWPPVSGSSGSRRTAWAPPARSASRASRTRSIRSRSPRSRQGRGRAVPGAYLDEQAMEIRLLFDHRNDLIPSGPAREPAAVASPNLCPELNGPSSAARSTSRASWTESLGGFGSCSRRPGQGRARAGLPDPQPRPSDRSARSRASRLSRSIVPSCSPSTGAGR